MRDEITIPADQIKPVMYFLLNSELTVESKSPGVTIKFEKSEIKAKDFGMDQEDFSVSSELSQKKYSVTFKKKIKAEARFSVEFSGKINYQIKQLGEEYARGLARRRV